MSNFSPVKHLASVIREIQNLEIKRNFNDIVNSDDDIARSLDSENRDRPILSSSPGRASLKLACTIKNQDSMIVILVRLFLYYVILRGSSLSGSNQQQGNLVYYGVPTTHHQMQRRFQPQISLWFQEDSNDTEPGYAQVEGEISFRIMNKSAEEITQADIESWARKIKQILAQPRYVWHKGKEMVSYTNWEQGYQLQILSHTKSDGESLVKNILQIQGHQFQRKSLNHNINNDPIAAYPTIPSSQRRRGKTVRLPRKRPVAKVKFCHAILHLWGEPNPVVLVDIVGNYNNAIEGL